MRYFLYYAGLSKDTHVEQVGVATSSDLKIWSYEGHSPIIRVKSQGVFDSEQTSNPCVLKHNGVYKMWYQGRSIDGLISICYAESIDGLSWTPGQNQILSPVVVGEQNFREGFHHPHVIYDKENATFKMWCVVYHNGLTSIGYCESKNGINWTEIQNTDLESKNEKLKYFYPFVMKDEGVYKMWFTERNGKKWQISFASSDDGKSWNLSTRNPIITKSYNSFTIFVFEAFAKLFGYCPNISLYGVGSPFVWKDGNKYFLIGHAVGPRGKLYIPMYESLDGLLWNKVKNNILPRPVTVWNSFFQADPFIYAE